MSHRVPSPRGAELADREAQITHWFREHRASRLVLTPTETTAPETTGTATPPSKHVVHEELLWRKPGSGFYLVRYLIVGPCLYVSGDLDAAIYRWSGELSWEFLAGCDLDYFASKCEASANGVPFAEWTPEIAEEDFKLRVAERRIERDDNEEPPFTPEMEEAVEDGLRAIRDGMCDRRHEWLSWLRDQASEVFGDDWWDGSVAIVGERIGLHCQAHLMGIQMAVAQLRADGLLPPPVREQVVEVAP